MIKLSIQRVDKLLQDVANGIRRQIRKNTEAGIDMNGRAFAPYSEAYVRSKADYIGNGKVTKSSLGRASHVNLKRTSMMINAISVKKVGKGYNVYVADQSRAFVAYAHHMGKGQKKREFFGISKANADSIFKQYYTPIMVKA